MMLFGLILTLVLPYPPEDSLINALREGRSPVSHTLTIENAAIGVQDAGEVSNVITNWGVVFSSPHFMTPAVHWPRNAPFQHQYCFGVMFFAGTKDNLATVHNRFALETTDWTPLPLFNTEALPDSGFPFMATSTDSSTWPGGVWPGPWRVDPSTGEPVPGQFTSDKDLYCGFTDKNNPEGSLGLEVRQLAYSYGRYYAEDFLVVRMWVINRGSSVIDSFYMGLNGSFRVDFDLEDYLRLTSFRDSFPNVLYYWDANGVPDDPWVSLGMVAIAVLETPDSVGITDFHYFDRTFDPQNDVELWPIVSSNPYDPDIDSSNYFHGHDIRIDETPPPTPGPYNFVISVGPIDLEPGDSIPFAFAVVLGEDSTDLFHNLDVLFKMRDKEYQGITPPKPPIVRVTYGDGWVRLFWDREPSEVTPDPFTGELDFEGYKIYRSDDFGLTWGKEITDLNGDVVGYVPLAVFDAIDGIKGQDPAFPYQTLGGDYGIKHSFMDTTVTNGVTYWYCVTAYDKGNQNPDSLVPSLESPKGRPDLSYVVEVTPGPRPPEWVPGDVLQGEYLTPSNGRTDAQVSYELLDPDEITGDRYMLEVIDIGQEVGLKLVDESVDSVLFDSLPVPDTLVPDALPVTDGFRIKVKDVSPGYGEVGWSLVHGDTSTFDWFVEDRGWGGTVFRGTDDFYLIVDTTFPSLAEVWRLRSYSQDTPFIPVDTTVYLPLRGEVEREDGERVPVSKMVLIEARYLIPPPPETQVSPPGWDLTPGGLAWIEDTTTQDRFADQIGMIYFYVENGDTVDSSFVYIKTLHPPWGIPPQDGDEFKISLRKPLKSGLLFPFETSASFYDMDRVTLDKVKVVPNPYVVSAGWETSEGNKKIAFTHLPKKCTIKIYNIAGELINTLEKDDESGVLFWDLRTKHGLDVSYGLYIYVVETPDGKKREGKFGVIR